VKDHLGLHLKKKKKNKRRRDKSNNNKFGCKQVSRVYKRNETKRKVFDTHLRVSFEKEKEKDAFGLIDSAASISDRLSH